MATWPSGLRRQLQALVRKGEGSNPSVVTLFIFGLIINFYALIINTLYTYVVDSDAAASAPHPALHNLIDPNLRGVRLASTARQRPQRHALTLASNQDSVSRLSPEPSQPVSLPNHRSAAREE